MAEFWCHYALSVSLSLLPVSFPVSFCLSDTRTCTHHERFLVYVYVCVHVRVHACASGLISLSMRCVCAMFQTEGERSNQQVFVCAGGGGGCHQQQLGE